MRVESHLPLITRALLAVSPRPPVHAVDHGVEARLPVPLPAATPAAAQSVHMLVMLAAADPAIERRRKASAALSRGVETLAALHAELVAGPPSVDRLQSAAAWARATTPPEDPALHAVYRDLDLRVRVELAKYDIQV